MIYGIVRVELDDFSAQDVHWVPDLTSIVLFRSEAIRNDVLRELADNCGEFEDYEPIEMDFYAKKKRDAERRYYGARRFNGQFTDEK